MTRVVISSSTYFILGAVNVCLISRGAQSPGRGCPFKNASACSGSLAESDLNSALNSLRRGLSGSRLLGESRGRISVHTRLGAEREHGSEVVDDGSELSVTSLFGSAKYDGLSRKGNKMYTVIILTPY